jgi:Zn-dependent protease
MLRFLKKLPVHIPLPSLFFFCFLLWLEPSSYTVLPLLAALLHEGGHLLAMLFFGRKIAKITLYPFGADIRAQGMGGYREDLCISAAGIAANLVTCAFCAPHLEHEGILCFFASNLLLALLNLLPVETLDGAAILCCILLRFCDWERARALLRRVSFVSLIALWIFATYLLFFTSSSFSFFTMTLYLFACLFLGKPKGRICEKNKENARF